MAKFIRVESSVTGHQFDIHEEQFDESAHKRVKRYPPSKRVRRTKFRVGRLPARSVSPTGEKGATDVASNSKGD
ncbi:hypothetical protein [Leucobacter sp. M11]|uniref:hypothetical protein n=1 Tax=Leucobacter sp. M11 TaxID=2993565 RepID=UPI002D7EC245|nr:hypothetical protein [Leucobacter sp. M11]MEB4613998.1 hypothetical protein [Leucobacter sp. M11]